MTQLYADVSLYTNPILGITIPAQLIWTDADTLFMKSYNDVKIFEIAINELAFKQHGAVLNIFHGEKQYLINFATRRRLNAVLETLGGFIFKEKLVEQSGIAEWVNQLRAAGAQIH